MTKVNADSTRSDPSLKARLVFLTIYVVGLYLAAGAITDSWRPTGGGEWLWWISAIALYVFNALSAPFFVRPRDSLANAISAALLLLTVDLSAVQNLRPEIEAFRSGMFAVAVATGILATIAVALHGVPQSDPSMRGTVARLSYKLAVAIGSGTVMFTGPALISIIGFHQVELSELLWLAMLWVFIVAVHPGELLYVVWRVVRRIKDENPSTRCVGHVVRVDDPNLVRVSLDSATTWKPSRRHSACLPGNRHVAVIPLFVQTQDDTLLGTGLFSDVAENNGIGASEVWTTLREDTSRSLIAQLAGSSEETELVGFVVEDSSIAAIRFEVASTWPLEEGTVIFVRDRDQSVYYQVLDASTREEVFAQNPRGTHIVTAAQLGTHNGNRFRKYGWVPPMNGPVFLHTSQMIPASNDTVEPDEFTLGSVPGTQMRVLASLKNMADHHTAILGVTGTGKTELVFDLIEAHVAAGRKVFCVDCTGEYEPRLTSRIGASALKLLGFDEDALSELDDLVNATEHGTYGAPEEKQALHTWVVENRTHVRRKVSEFMTSGVSKVGIFDLPDIANTRATLRATEMYISAIFAWAKRNRGTQELVVVLEEAHTVVPEWNLYRSDKADTDAAVGRMSQIALQGRKYGVGLLLVSQRTALVSKTLLSQCNTCICFAMYDKTGLDYLASVFASEHVRALPNLRFLQGIAFGKAIRSDYPVIFEIQEDSEKRAASEALNSVPGANPEGVIPLDEGPLVEDASALDSGDDDLPF